MTESLAISKEFPLDSDEARLLVEIAYCGLARGLLSHAGRVFTGVLAVRPDLDAARVGLALIDLRSGQPAAAEHRLRGCPPSDAARLFLGWALRDLGDKAEARRILDDVAATSSELAYADTARQLLAGM